ncbi:MAG: hypothetical protein ACREIF_03725, partial [Chthoniobacterales bacterium]
MTISPWKLHNVFTNQNSSAPSGFFHPASVLGLVLCAAGILLATFSVATIAQGRDQRASSASALKPRPPLAPTGPGWSIVTSPNVSTILSDYLNGGVTCASASDCWAVGEYEDDTVCSHPLIEHWNGTSWSIATSPDPGPETVLTSVTCASASDCWAVGSGSTQALIEHWDGTSWSI